MLKKQVLVLAARQGEAYKNIMKGLNAELGPSRHLINFEEFVTDGPYKALLEEKVQRAIDSEEYDLIITIGDGAAHCVKRVIHKNSTDIKVVACGLSGPVRSGFIRHINKSGTNFLCVASSTPSHIITLQIIFLLEPTAASVAVPYRPETYNGAARQYLQEAKAYFKPFGKRVLLFTIKVEKIPPSFIEKLKEAELVATPEGCLLPGDVSVIKAMGEGIGKRVFTDGSEAKKKSVIYGLRCDFQRIGRYVSPRVKGLVLESKGVNDLTSVILQNLRSLSYASKKTSKRGFIHHREIICMFDGFLNRDEIIPEYGKVLAYFSALSQSQSVLAHVILSQMTGMVRELLLDHPELSNIVPLDDRSLDEQIDAMVKHATKETHHYVYGDEALVKLHAAMKKYKKMNSVTSVQEADSLEEAQGLQLKFSASITHTAFVFQTAGASLQLALCKEYMQNLRKVIFPVTIPQEQFSDAYRQRIEQECERAHVEVRWLVDEDVKAVKRRLRASKTGRLAVISIPRLTRQGTSKQLTAYYRMRTFMHCGPDLLKVVKYPLAVGVRDGAFEANEDRYHVEHRPGNVTAYFLKEEDVYGIQVNRKEIAARRGGKVDTAMNDIVRYSCEVVDEDEQE